MKKIKLYALIIFILNFSACSLFRKNEEIPPDLALMDKADYLFLEGKYSESLYLYIDVQQKYPTSKYLLASKLGEADCYLKKNLFDMANTTYLHVYQNARHVDQQKLKALATYKLSFTSEALKDDVRALAFSLEAYEQSAQLPDSLRFAEIPSRVSMLYSKLGKSNEAQKYLSIAEYGIEKLKKTKKQKEWFAKIYLEMGRVSINQLNEDNFNNFILGLQNNQKFLIKSMDLDVMPYSKESQSILLNAYKDLWNIIVTLPDSKKQSSESALKRKFILRDMSIKYINLIDEALKYENLEGIEMTSLQKDFFKSLKDMQRYSSNYLSSLSGDNELTMESQNKSKDKPINGQKSKDIPLVLPQKKGMPSAAPINTFLNEKDPNL